MHERVNSVAESGIVLRYMREGRENYENSSMRGQRQGGRVAL